MLQTTLAVHRLTARNSVSFLETAFRLYAERRLFTMERGDVDPSRIPGLVMAEEHAVDDACGWARLRHEPLISDEPAQIVFTSGTEGEPKPILLSHANLADVVARLNKAMQVDSEIREYVGVPVTYSFGFGRARAVSAAGGALYLPPNGFDPRQIRQMLERGEINAISAVPSLWRLALANPDAIGAAGAAVRWIEIGSQYMSRAEKEGMKALFPNARILQHYGLTEASRSTFLDISETSGEALESVGAPTGAVEVSIGAGGEIRIRGPHVALGTLGSDGRIVPLADTEGWLVTKDRGALRAGLLWYEGRLDDQINLGGVKLAAERLEREVAALVDVPADFAIAATADPLRGDGLLLACGPETAEAADLLEAALRFVLRRRGIEPGRALRTIRLDALPRTGTGKIRRRDLPDAEMPANDTPEVISGTEALTPAEDRVAAAWRRVLGAADISPASRFHDLGGDSLSAVQASLTMEAEGFEPAAIRMTVEGRPLREVAAAASEASTVPADLPTATVCNWSISSLRGLMVLLVIVVHWAPGVMERVGEEAAALYRSLSPLWRLGTPGFATVFGIGIGYFMLPGFAAKRASVAKRLRMSFMLVLSSLCLVGAAFVFRDLLQGMDLTGQLVAHGFYNVLAYYVLALGTAWVWLRALSSTVRSAPPILVVAGGFWAAGWLATALVPEMQIDGLAEWARLMAVAKYNYFRMTAIVFVGIAIGVWLASQEAPNAAARRLAAIGAAVALVALGITYEGGATSLTDLRATLGYIGVVAALLGGFLTLFLAWPRMGGPVRSVLQALVVTGAMSLPLFALHQIVIPVKDLLAVAGLHEGLALPAAMGAFLAGMGYTWLRVRRLFFGRAV